MKTTTINLYKISELDQKAREYALTELRYWNVESPYWYYGDWLLDYDIFNWHDDINFSLDYPEYIQFNNLTIKDEKRFFDLLQIPESVRENLLYSFSNTSKNTTEIVFEENDPDKPFSDEELYLLGKSYDIFAGIMKDALSALSNEYETLISDEILIEGFENNDIYFTKNGELFNLENEE